MKTRLILSLTVFAMALLVGVTGCATSKETRTVALLKQAGFKAMVATTFEKQQKLKTLKTDRISTVKATNGTIYYVYPVHADDLLYAGRFPEYSAYQKLVAAQKAEAATLKAERPGADVSWTERAESDESWKDVWTAPSDF